MKRIDLKNELSDEDVDKLAGEHLDETFYDTLLQEEAEVYKPNGDLLCLYAKQQASLEQCGIAYKSLHRIVGVDVNNRGKATGKDLMVYKPREDGLRSKTNKVLQNRFPKLRGSSSGIIGFFDRYSRRPYCRQTAYNINHTNKFADMMPFVKAVDDSFQKHIPERYAKQLEVVKRTHADFYISGTAFTTITVNTNWQTAIHKDQGDLKTGFGVMCALRSGYYEGCYLVFPKFRIAIDMQNQAICFGDVHEWHGNTPFRKKAKDAVRISLIFYYREKMQQCMSAKKELERAKQRKEGDPLYD